MSVGFELKYITGKEIAASWRGLLGIRALSGQKWQQKSAITYSDNHLYAIADYSSDLLIAVMSLALIDFYRVTYYFEYQPILIVNADAPPARFVAF